jgi:hypothetical protein
VVCGLSTSTLIAPVSSCVVVNNARRLFFHHKHSLG